MKKFYLALTLAIVCSSVSGAQEIIESAGEPAKQGTIARRVYDRVNYILENIKETKYVHSKDSCIDENAGFYKYDCSGFLGIYVINNVSPEYCNQLNRATKKGIVNNSRPCKVKMNCEKTQDQYTSRPLAEDFYYYFKEAKKNPSNKYFNIVDNFSDVKVGDIIAVKYSTDWQKDAKSYCEMYEGHGKNPSTGHVMIALSEPVKSKMNCIDCCKHKKYKNSRCTQHDEYYITIADSADSPHRKDSRDNCNSNEKDCPYINDKHKGIGKGTMYFGVNKEGEPIYYRWSDWDSYKYQTYDCNKNCKISDSCPSPCHEGNKFNICGGKVSKYDKIDSILVGRIKK